LISNQDIECILQIGDICCSLRFMDPIFNKLAQEPYKRFWDCINMKEKEHDLS
jgi:hypothetical protein